MEAAVTMTFHIENSKNQQGVVEGFPATLLETRGVLAGGTQVPMLQ
jgi:hypothetical protein